MTGNDTNIRNVVIVGRDADAWLTALALQLSFGRSGVDIELIELPSLLGPEDVYTTLPPQHAFHDLLGFDENRLLTASGGLFALGQRFANFSGAAPEFLHAYDTHGIELNNVDFVQHWLRARAGGLTVPLEDFSLGAAAAKQGRFVVFNEETGSFSSAAWGYHLDAIPYLKTIAKAALAAGLKHTVADVPRVDTENDRIRSLTLADGRVLEADLYVDASGRAATLIGKLDAGNWASWSKWLPCDRVLSGSAPPLTPVPPFAQVSAFKSGWLGIHPLMRRTALVGALSSEHTDIEQVPELVGALSGLRLEGNLVVAPFEAGTRKRHWIGNCVALGDAGTRLEPMDAVQLHMLHTGVSWLTSLFPVDRDNTIEANVFNDKVVAHAEGLRDFQAAHYQLNRRFDDPFWNAARIAKPPASLARKLALFKARGVVSMGEYEAFQEENWTAILIGHGLTPESWDPLADKLPESEQIANFRRMLRFIADEVQAMPSLQAHLEMNAPASSEYIF